MSKKPRLTTDELDIFLAHVKSGATYRQAAKEIGRCIEAIRAAFERYDYPWPKRLCVVDRIKAFEDEIFAGTINQHDIARQLGVTQCAVSRAYQKLNYPSFPRGAPKPTEAVNQQRLDDCQRVIDHIKANGGRIKTAVKALGLPDHFRRRVSEYGEQIGFDFDEYIFAHRQYGAWLTIPCKPIRVYNSDYKIKAICTDCGTTYEVTLINMKAGRSSRCQSCAYERRRATDVRRSFVCVETGEVFKSLRQLSLHIGIAYNTLKYRLTNKDHIEHVGFTYKLVSSS